MKRSGTEQEFLKFFCWFHLHQSASNTPSTERRKSKRGKADIKNCCVTNLNDCCKSVAFFSILVFKALNLELDLQSLFRLHVHSCTHWRSDPAKCRKTPLLPPHLGSCTRALLVGQDRRHLFVTPLFLG